MKRWQHGCFALLFGAIAALEVVCTLHLSGTMRVHAVVIGLGAAVFCLLATYQWWRLRRPA